MATAFTATAVSGGGVRLQLTFTTVQIASVVRVHPDGSTYTVRAGTGGLGTVPILSTTGIGWSGFDYELPLDTTVTYRATSTQAVGTTVTSNSVSVPSDTSNSGSMAYLTHPLKPTLSQLLYVKSVDPTTRQARGGALTIIGRADPIARTDVRLTGSGTMTCLTTTANEATALKALLADGSVLLWRAPAAWTGDTWKYWMVGDLGDSSVAEVATETWREWQLPYTMVARPVGATAGTSGNTYEDARLQYATYALLKLGEASYTTLST